MEPTSNELERRYEFIVNTSKELMTLIDRNYVYEAANQAYCHAHNKTRAEIIGQRVKDVWGTQLFDEVIKEKLELSFDGHEVHYENWFEFAHLGSRCFDVAYYPYHNHEGVVSHLVVVSRDVTEQTQAQQALQQLIKSERLAALGRLAAALAHEINNPLQAIQIQLELVLDYPLTAGQRKHYLERTRQEIERLSLLTQRIFNFARPAKMPRRVVSLPDLVEHTLALVKKQLQINKIKLQTYFSVAPLVRAAPDQLQQVFLNLILNAIEAMPNGGQLQVMVKEEAHQAVISFSNTGSSISPEHFAHIFEPFFTTKEEGSGMGLSTSLTIIDDHGGTLEAENLAQHEGVCFSVRLPVVKEISE
jgi:PAS domain S-box-containing protein